MIINVGTQEQVIEEVTPGAGMTSRDASIRGDSILASLYVNSVSSGTLTITIFTFTEPGREAILLSFPVVSAPTANLLLSASGPSLQNIRVAATYTGICDYEVYVRAVSGIANQAVNITNTVNVSIQPPTVWTTSQNTVTTTTSLLIASALTARKGLLVKNWSTTTDVYLGESGSLTFSNGYPLAARDAISIDVAAGSAVYAVTASGTADVRIVQAGS